ncbi:hypothetical protein B0H12DRAFT_82626 [Mycena haematopus]|nr:hypothetical protein B0H12DRAFT_82626 [Mycena haematopus]
MLRPRQTSHLESIDNISVWGPSCSARAKYMLLGDVRFFLASEKWYADCCIPFRRGYLLHRVPGSGKSSLPTCDVGERMLDIYVVSLSSAFLWGLWDGCRRPRCILHARTLHALRLPHGHRKTGRRSAAPATSSATATATA